MKEVEEVLSDETEVITVEAARGVPFVGKMKDIDTDILGPELLKGLKSYEVAKRFKSVARAIRKGYMLPSGIIAPRRPFNNRKRTDGRKLETRKEKLYGQLRYSQGL